MSGPGGSRSLTWLPFVLAMASCQVAAGRPGPVDCGPSPSLAGRIDPLIRVHKGKVAVAVKNLRTGESFRYHADEVMPTASLIKFPVMIEVYRLRRRARSTLMHV